MPIARAPKGTDQSLPVAANAIATRPTSAMRSIARSSTTVAATPLNATASRRATTTARAISPRRPGMVALTKYPSSIASITRPMPIRMSRQVRMSEAHRALRIQAWNPRTSKPGASHNGCARASCVATCSMSVVITSQAAATTLTTMPRTRARARDINAPRSSVSARQGAR